MRYKRVLLSYDDRVRADSTAVYFLKAFQDVLGWDNVDHVYPEHLPGIHETLMVKGHPYDLYLKVDDGLSQHEWNKNLHPSAYYVIDTHIDYEWRRDLAERGAFDFMFFAQRNALDMKWHTKNVSWVPLGTELQRHHVSPQQKKYDACFIGNFHTQHAQRRVTLCDALFRACPSFYYGSRTFLDMAKKYAESRLVFNCGINGDVNMRFFEGLQSGSALLTDVLQDQEQLGFKEGVHYIGYNNEGEMLEKARYYLRDSDKREWIAKNGFELVSDKHQYVNRVNEILTVVNREPEEGLLCQQQQN